MTTPHPISPTAGSNAGEVVGLDQSIAYASTIAAEAGEHAPAGNEAYLAHLYAAGVTGPGLSTARHMQDAFAAAQGSAERHAAELERQRGVQEAYDQAPDAGDKTYLTGADHTGTASIAPETATMKGTSVTTDQVSDQAAPPSAEASGYRRCDNCSYVLNPQMSTYQRCPNCMTGTEFTATTIERPARPSDEAIAADTRDVEAQIRATYARLAAGQDGSIRIVPLTDLRAALPADLPRETVDAALSKLAAHPDVHINPSSDHHQTNPETQAAALPLGGQYNHHIFIQPNDSLTTLLQVVHSTDAAHATSILAPLDARDVALVAERMGVDPQGPTETVRQRIVAQSAANRDAWLADARQGEEDGTLLARADTEPEWVAGWTAEDRQRAAEAAARLQHRADTEPSWAYIRDRANRWAAPQA